MKITVVILLSLAVAFATNVKTDSLLTAQTKDAVQSALNILYDLRKANLESEKSADGRNRSDESNGLKNIQALTNLVNLNKHTLDHATAYRKQVENDHTDTSNYIKWLNGRIGESRRKVRQLHKERCYANALFVKAIKENEDALKVIELLGQDLKGYLSSASQLNLAQVQDVADKLKLYSHLFKESAVKQFTQLASESTLNVNEQDKQTLDQQRSKIQQLLDALRKNLLDGFEALKTNEIQAAYDLARFVSDSENEIAWIRDELARKKTYLDRLNMLLTGAKNAESKAKESWDNAVKTLNTSTNELRNKRYFYAREKARRVEENSLIEELIRLFRDRVGAMGESNVL